MPIAGQRCLLRGAPGKNHPSGESKLSGCAIAVSPGVRYYHYLSPQIVKKNGQEGIWIIMYKRVSRDTFEYQGAEVCWEDAEERKAFDLSYEQLVAKYGQTQADYLMKRLKA